MTLAAANLSCSRYERVPKTAYRQLDPSDAEKWKVETEDGTVYAVRRFSVTDSTLVIEEFACSMDSATREYTRVTRVPYALDLDEVRSVEKWVEGNKPAQFSVAGLAIVVVGVVLIVILLWSAMAHAAGSSLNADN